MAIGIGNKTDSDFADPIGLLEDCHRRIEKFLNVLLTLAGRAQGHSLTDEERRAIQTSLQYFREAAPKHTADEEESLFPRLRASQHHAAKDLLSNLDQLHTDHVAADQTHRAIEELFQQWLVEGSLSPADSIRLNTLLQSLQDAYARHIKEEESQIFPKAARILSSLDLQAVGAEMAQRRGL